MLTCNDCLKKTQVRMSQYLPYCLVCVGCELKRSDLSRLRAIDSKGWNV